MIYMTVVEEGDKVHVLCEVKLEDGKVYYKTEKKKPIGFIVGEGKFFSAIENKLMKMKEGETKVITLEPKDAFGLHNDDLVVETPKDNFRSNADIDIGSRVKLNTASGQTVHGTIIEIKDDVYAVDFNLPLAGRKVVFSVTVVSIEGN